MLKDVNRYTSNEFHEWQRKNLPSKFVIQDLDAWPIVISDSENDYEPICIVELKRSFYKPKDWNPYKADLPNYMALFKLAIKANIPFVTIYFKKDEIITDDSKFALFKITDVKKGGSDWISFDKKILTAAEFKNNFPDSMLFRDDEVTPDA